MPPRKRIQPYPPSGTTTTTQPRSPEEIIEQGPGGGRRPSDEPLPIGVPVGYTIPVPYTSPTNYYPSGFNYGTGQYGEGARQPIPGSLQEQGPRYFDGDEWRPAALSPDSIVELQRQMVQAGLISPTIRFRLGVWDEVSRNAYRDLLAFANARGVPAESAMVLYRASAEAEATATGEIGGVGVEEIPPLIIRQTPIEDLESVFREAAVGMTGRGWNQDQIRNAVAAFNQIEAQRQREAYNAQLGGQDATVTDIPSPSAFIEGYIRGQEPEEVESETGLSFINEFIDIAQRGWD